MTELTAAQNELVTLIQNWQKAQALIGLNLDENTPEGAANIGIVAAFMAVNKLPYDVPSLDSAVRLSAKRFTWAAGFGPSEQAPVPQARLSEAELAAEMNKRRAKISDREEADKAREDEEKRLAYVRLQQSKADAEAQAKEEAAATVWYDGGNRPQINHGATNSALAEIRKRWAQKHGRSLAPTGIREIDLDREPPYSRAELSAFTPEEIQRAIAKQNNRKRGGR
jgi:hypothetical protein